MQQTLSGISITLNNAPAGVKDASEKRILVDILIWVTDDPALADHLLIFDDRIFFILSISRE